MAELLNRFDSAHVGPLHDIQVDYYSTKLATASSDRSIRIWDITNEKPSFLTELRGHDGPVWQVCWAHPQFGCLLASCGYDKRIIIWQSQEGNDMNMRSSQNSNSNNNRQQCQFSPIYINEEHAASVNSVCFAPWELGLGVAASSTDGSVSICWHKGSNEWAKESFSAHFNGVNAVSWAPPIQSAMLLQGGSPTELGDGFLKAGSKLLATGGCDNQVRIWAKNEQKQQWQEIAKLNENGHTDWVRDVSFQPSSLTSSIFDGSLLLVSCSEDQTIKLWKGEGSPRPGDPSIWKCIQTISVGVPVWKLSWSSSGNILAAACGDSNVTLFRENLNGKWEKVSNLSEIDDPKSAMFEHAMFGNNSTFPTSSSSGQPGMEKFQQPQYQHQFQQAQQQQQQQSQQQNFQLSQNPCFPSANTSQQQVPQGQVYPNAINNLDFNNNSGTISHKSINKFSDGSAGSQNDLQNSIQPVPPFSNNVGTTRPEQRKIGTTASSPFGGKDVHNPSASSFSGPPPLTSSSSIPSYKVSNFLNSTPTSPPVMPPQSQQVPVAPLSSLQKMSVAPPPQQGSLMPATQQMPSRMPMAPSPMQPSMVSSASANQQIHHQHQQQQLFMQQQQNLQHNSNQHFMHADRPY